MSLSKFKATLLSMPPLRHSVDGQVFDITDSDVVNWLIAQPDVLQALFRKAQESKCIAFDPATKLWAGLRQVAEPANGRPEYSEEFVYEVMTNFALGYENAHTLAELHVRLGGKNLHRPALITTRKACVRLEQQKRIMIQRPKAESNAPWYFWVPIKATPTTLEVD